MSAEKKILVTAAGPNVQPLLEQYSLPTFQSYAAVHDYEVRVESIVQDGSEHVNPLHRAARWAKLNILRKTLKECDTMVWFDADVMICRDDEDIADGLDDGCFQGLVLDWVPSARRINPNTGVWVMRNCPTAHEFLDAVVDAGQQPGPWADQASVMKVLGWLWKGDNYAGARPGSGSHYLDGTTWLGEGWNQPDLSSLDNARAWQGRPTVDNPHAIHFMGMKNNERLIKMSNLATQLNTTSVPNLSQMIHQYQPQTAEIEAAN